MSLATILWERKKKKSVFDSAEAITRGVSCREESSYRCFWTSSTMCNNITSAVRLSSSFIRSKGNSLYLVDGARRRPSVVHLGGFQQEDKMKTMSSGDTTAAKRRCSDPDLIIRRRMNLFTPSVNHSVGDLMLPHSSSMKEPPIFVVVSIPDGTTNETVGSQRVNQQFESSLSTRRRHSLIFDNRPTIDNGHHHQSGFGHQHNSLSCPLISPWIILRLFSCRDLQTIVLKSTISRYYLINAQNFK